MKKQKTFFSFILLPRKSDGDDVLWTNPHPLRSHTASKFSNYCLNSWTKTFRSWLWRLKPLGHATRSRLNEKGVAESLGRVWWVNPLGLPKPVCGMEARSIVPWNSSCLPENPGKWWPFSHLLVGTAYAALATIDGWLVSSVACYDLPGRRLRYLSWWSTGRGTA